MYELIETLMGVCIAALGIYMAVAPKSATRKDLREDENAIAKTKRSGTILIVVGIALTILMVITNFVMK